MATLQLDRIAWERDVPSVYENRIGVVTEGLQDLLRNVISRKPIEQAIIGVESGDESFRWISAKGHTESGDEVSEQTPFFIASIDKLFNAVIVLMLNEAGQLHLDDPLTSYLPSSLTQGLHKIDGSDHTAHITLRHLLTHTSGLPDWLEDHPKRGPSLIDRVLEEGDRSLTLDELSAVVRDQLKPHFAPQDPFANRPKVRYSDTNFMLLAAVIEAVTRQPLHSVHEAFLHKPLGLRHTYFAGYSQPLDPTPPPMVLRANGEPLRIPRLIRSIKGIYSTAPDMMSFMRQLLQNKVFKSSNTLQTMLANWLRFGFPLDRAALRSPSWPIEYAMGTMRFRLPRIFTPRKAMPLVLGHTGSTGCWLFYCPELDAFLAGSVDEVTAGAAPFKIVPQILNVIRDSGWKPSSCAAH